MPKYHGIDPQPATRQAAEQFENEIMIRMNNRFLIASVYLDMEETRWAVAIAYNPVRNPGLCGTENLLEVRYSYEPRHGHRVLMLRSDPPENTVIPCRRFPDPDEFVRHVLLYERSLIHRPF